MFRLLLPRVGGLYDVGLVLRVVHDDILAPYCGSHAVQSSVYLSSLEF